jgi:hypothetical protein
MYLRIHFYLPINVGIFHYIKYMGSSWPIEQITVQLQLAPVTISSHIEQVNAVCKFFRNLVDDLWSA